MPPVNNNQLTDLNTFKQWIGIENSDVSVDASLIRLIAVASGVIRKWINRENFIATDLIENYRGNNSTRLILNTQPVNSVASVLIGNQTLQPYSTWYQGGYSFDKYGLTGINYGFGYQEYTVSYNGGFLLASPEASMAEQAVISLCYLWWKRRPHTDQSVQSLGQQVTAKFIQDELPPETKAIIKVLTRVA